jgi:hypothetical protein
MAKAKAVTNDDTVVILEQSTKSISGKSDLIFNVGLAPDEKLMIRIKSNSGSGLFSNRWICMQALFEKLSAYGPDERLTSFSLKALTSASANDPGFLAAALKALKILVPMEGKQRSFVVGDIEGFLAEARVLTKGNGKSRKPKAKAKAKAAPNAIAKTPAKATAKTAKTPRKTPARSKKAS